MTLSAEWFPVFQKIVVPSGHQEPLTQQHSTTPHKTWIFTMFLLLF